MKIASARRSRSAYSRLHFAEDAHAQARARERMAEHHVARQAELEAELAHFVLEQLAQRLEQLQMQRLGQAADVVVRLDRVRLLGLRAGRLDHVGIDRALREPADACGSFAASRWKTSTNRRPMILRFCSGSATPASAAGTRRPHRRGSTLTPRWRREGLHHLLGLVQAQQAVIDEDAGQLVADRAMEQRRRNRRIDAAGQPEDHFVARRPARGCARSPRRRSRACSSRAPQPQMSCTKRARIALPCSVCVTSGWNCTP